MPREWSAKRERQYRHIVDSEEQRGVSPDEAEEIAARTVNKARARSGESKTSSSESTEDMSSQKRAARRRSTGERGPTYDQLYAEARRRNLRGRSRMNKSELSERLGKR
jgi:plasmid stabilization system protein ParE